MHIVKCFTNCDLRKTICDFLDLFTQDKRLACFYGYRIFSISSHSYSFPSLSVCKLFQSQDIKATGGGQCQLRKSFFSENLDRIFPRSLVSVFPPGSLTQEESSPYVRTYVRSQCRSLYVQWNQSRSNIAPPARLLFRNCSPPMLQAIVSDYAFKFIYSFKFRDDVTKKAAILLYFVQIRGGGRAQIVWSPFYKCIFGQ